MRRILREHGIDPAPERRKHLPWKTFLRAHWGAIAAADFFTVEIWTRTGLTRYFVFFVMDLATRKIEVAGITAAPSGVWMTQIARNLTDVAIGFLSDDRYLICDRDPSIYAGVPRNAASGGGDAGPLAAAEPHPNGRGANPQCSGHLPTSASRSSGSAATDTSEPS